MAIAQGDGSIVLTTKVDETGLKKGLGSIKKIGTTAGKAFLAIGVAAATATVAITKMATDAYAEYEQLVGGVETLFKSSADKVMAYAENAFYTAGVSANEYMKQVTSFSASLIRSTAGDTDKAADIANMALIDISDNVNKLGSSMESVTLAYQGFAKQQYMLLDNLKLGYGGTKTEMERLLRDAEELTGVKYDINNLADVYSAIHAIQEELGITGTTTKEAEKTITGSANMMKAAWKNTLSAISGGGDLDRAINNLVYSIQKYFENIVPVVERSLQGIGQLIERVAPMLVQTVARALIKAIPSLLNAVYQMIIGLAKGIYQGIIALFSGGAQKVVEAQTNEIAQSVENQNALTEAVEETAKAQKGALAGFDELNTLSKETAEESFGGLSVGSSKTEDTADLATVDSAVSGISNAFQSQAQKISSIVAKIWNSEPIKAFVNASNTYLETLKINASKTWNNIKSDLKRTGRNIGTLATNIWRDFNKSIQTWSPSIIDSSNTLFDSILSGVIDPFVQTSTSVWSDFTDCLVDLWDEHGGMLTNNIGEFTNTTIGLFQSLYDNVIEPIIKPFMEMLTWLWDKHLKDMVYTLGEFIMSLANGLMEIYNQFIEPLVNFLLDILSPAWSFLSSLVIGVIGSIVGAVTDFSKGIIKILKGVIDFIVGIFTGNWEKAWNGVKSIFTGVWDAMSGVAKGVVNVIIDALNAFVAGINKISFDVPNWVPLIGGKKWGFNIPKIPKLAQGAVIPGGREFLAVLGDQPRGQTNIETPAGLIKQMVVEAMNEYGFGGGNQPIVIEIDGREVFRAVKNAEMRYGSQTIIGGVANAY